jgi:hypothetical protein
MIIPANVVAIAAMTTSLIALARLMEAFPDSVATRQRSAAHLVSAGQVLAFRLYEGVVRSNR